MAAELAASHDLALHCRRETPEIRSLADRLRRRGARVTILTADLAGPGDGGDLVRRARAALPRLSLLVNNASLLFAARTAAERRLIRRVNAGLPIALAESFCRLTRRG